MTVEVAGNQAFVTGSSRGIGRGIALRLAECGIQEVGVHYHQNEAAAQETLEMLQDRGAEGFIVQGDLSKLEDVQRVFSTVEDELGSLDVFVSNARSDLERFYEPVMDIPLEKWQDAIDGQARAFMVGARESSKLMSGDRGRIVAITYAPGGVTGTWRSWVAMGTAQGAVEALSRYFAVALADQGITVNTVSPGLTDDSVLNSLPPEAFDMIKDRCGSGWVPMNRMTTPGDVGNIVSLLCSEEAGFLTGQVIYADGGAQIALPDLPWPLQQG